MPRISAGRAVGGRAKPVRSFYYTTRARFCQPIRIPATHSSRDFSPFCLQIPLRRGIMERLWKRTSGEKRRFPPAAPSVPSPAGRTARRAKRAPAAPPLRKSQNIIFTPSRNPAFLSEREAAPSFSAAATCAAPSARITRSPARNGAKKSPRPHSRTFFGNWRTRARTISPS